MATRQAEEAFKDLACCGAQKAIYLSRLRQVYAMFDGYSWRERPGLRLWVLYRFLWWRRQALMWIRSVRTFDRSWSESAERKFIKELRKPIQELPDG